MALIPDEEINKQGHLNLAPMVDFLFLILAVFAVLAVTRAAIFDTEVNLVKLKTEKTPGAQSAAYVVNLSITEKGQYKWVTETNEFLMDGIESVQKQLFKEQESGALPRDKEKVKILLHIDRNARWEPIAKMIVGVRETGLNVHPVYEIE